MYPDQIAVYSNVPTQNASGGFTTTPQLELFAPTWGFIEQVDGSQGVFSTRDELQRTYRIRCRYRDDFTWTNKMYVSTRFGNLQVIGVEETKRKREWLVTASIVG